MSEDETGPGTTLRRKVSTKEERAEAGRKLLGFRRSSKRTRARHAARAATVQWSRLTPEQRSAEMRRRRRLGIKRKRLRALGVLKD